MAAAQFIRPPRRDRRFLSSIKPTIFEEFEALEDWASALPEKDILREPLTNVLLSIGSGPVGTTLDALRKLDAEVKHALPEASAAPLHFAIDQLIQQLGTGDTPDRVQ